MANQSKLSPLLFSFSEYILKLLGKIEALAAEALEARREKIQKDNKTLHEFMQELGEKTGWDIEELKLSARHEALAELLPKHTVMMKEIELQMDLLKAKETYINTWMALLERWAASVTELQMSKM